MPVDYAPNFGNPEKENKDSLEFRIIRSKENLKDNSSSEEYEVYSSEGDKIGIIGISYFEKDKHSQFYWVQLDDYLRGLGIGKEIYKKAIELSKDKGYSMRSATAISEDAINVWKRLVQEGLADELGDDEYRAK